MTDNEIIESLKCCARINKLGCVRCNFNGDDDCSRVLVGAACYLINRQKTEIRITRIEAIKEFAEKLKSYMSNLEANSPNKAYKTAMEDMLSYYVPKIIDDVVKEMTGDTNG